MNAKQWNVLFVLDDHRWGILDYYNERGTKGSTHHQFLPLVTVEAKTNKEHNLPDDSLWLEHSLSMDLFKSSGSIPISSQILTILVSSCSVFNILLTRSTSWSNVSCENVTRFSSLFAWTSALVRSIDFPGGGKKFRLGARRVGHSNTQIWYKSFQVARTQSAMNGIMMTRISNEYDVSASIGVESNEIWRTCILSRMVNDAAL